MNIKCKICAKLDHCPACDVPGHCGRFGIDMDKLIETADEISREHNLMYENALRTIDICLRHGGYISD